MQTQWRVKRKVWPWFPVFAPWQVQAWDPSKQRWFTVEETVSLSSALYELERWQSRSLVGVVL